MEYLMAEIKTVAKLKQSLKNSWRGVRDLAQW